MFNWFKRSTLDPLSVTMVGVKLADRVLVIGCRDPRLIAALAIKAGLTGRACAVDASEAVVREAERIALKEGALAEFSTAYLATLPFDAGAFDVVVLRDVMRAHAHEEAPDRVSIAGESARVLRPGGRCMVIDSVGAAGVSGMLGRSAPGDATAAGDLSTILMSVGFVAVRTLAERDGLLFLEAIKKA
jgi:SAM-dependent methyltransferase